MSDKYNCMEVVEIRLFKSELCSIVSDLFEELGRPEAYSREGVVGLGLFSRSDVASDWKIVIFRNVINLLPEKTTPGKHLAAILSEFGIVNHELWRFRENDNRQKSTRGKRRKV